MMRSRGCPLRITAGFYQLDDFTIRDLLGFEMHNEDTILRYCRKVSSLH